MILAHVLGDYSYSSNEQESEELSPGSPQTPAAGSDELMTVLHDLERGEISVEEALELLENVS
jgi:hypothetical protein